MSRHAGRVPAPPIRKKAAPAAARPQPHGPSHRQRAAMAQAIQRRQARAAESAAPAAEPAAKTPNRSGLPKWLQSGVERLSGLFMDDVKVHRDSAEPARLGALAYTKGSDIHLGPGQEQHLPHEAWHVVQQKQGRVQATTQMKGVGVNEDAGLEAEADRIEQLSNQVPEARMTAAREQSVDAVAGAGRPRSSSASRLATGVVQRQATYASKIKKDDTGISLGKILRGPDFKKGFKLVFYQTDGVYPEFISRSAMYAKQEKALGFTGGKPTLGSVVVGKAIHVSLGIKEMSAAIADLAADALGQVPAPADMPKAEAEAPAKIASLTIFGHGWETGTNTELVAGKEKDLISPLSSKISSSIKVVLFACSTGRSEGEAEDWYGGVMKSGGDTSLASGVRDELADAGAAKGEVWAHAVSAHFSKNPVKRIFEVSEGKGTPGKSYVADYVFTDREFEKAAANLAVAINKDGYVLDPASAKYKEAAAKIFKENGIQSYFYSAYIEAWNTLGWKIAEDAPEHPVETAEKIRTYWTDIYWPKRRKQATAAIVKALKLKKAGVEPGASPKGK